VMADHPPTDLRWGEKIPALLLLAALLFIGFWPKSISDPIDHALHRAWPAAGALPVSIVSK